MNDQHYAIVIGINRYPGISNLQFARGDAEAFFNWLADPNLGAVPAENIARITVSDADMPPGTDRKDAIPVRTQVEEALSDFWERCSAHIDDHPADWYKTRLYIFGSGHGIAPEPREVALLMANAAPKHYGNNFPYEKFITFFQKAQFFRELVFFADCCRERVSTAPLLGPTWDEINNQNGKIFTLRGLATYFGELAFEEDDDDGAPPDELRGYFTKALLEGLNGQAADTRTGEINSQTLANYVTERVRKLTSHRPKPQTPFFAAEPITPAIIFRENVSVIARHAVTIEFPPGFTGDAALRDGDMKTIAAHAAADGNLHVSLASGFYRVAPAAGENTFHNGGFFEVIGAERYVKL